MSAHGHFSDIARLSNGVRLPRASGSSRDSMCVSSALDGPDIRLSCFPTCSGFRTRPAAAGFQGECGLKGGSKLRCSSRRLDRSQIALESEFTAATESRSKRRLPHRHLKVSRGGQPRRERRYGASARVYSDENSIDDAPIARHGPHEPVEVRRPAGTDRAPCHVVNEFRRTSIQSTLQQLEPMLAPPLIYDLAGTAALVIVLDNVRDLAGVHGKEAVGLV
jgi:hypothetical protein